MPTEDYNFNKRVQDKDLSPAWLQFKYELADCLVWSDFSHYGAFCSSHGVDPQQAGEQWTLKFLIAFAASGRSYGPLRVSSMRNHILRLHSEKPQIATPPLAPNPPRAAPRKAQWQKIAPSLRDDIATFVGSLGEADPLDPSDEAEKKRAASQDEKKRFLLRQIENVEKALGRRILHLRQLFEDDALEALHAAGYGQVSSDLPWDHSTTAIHTRSRLLELGRRYAYEVLNDEDLGDALDDYLATAPSHQKRRATLSAKDRQASRQIDDQKKVKKLIVACRQSAFGFGARPNCRSYATAQTAIAILFLLATGRAPFTVRTAAFTGPARTMPSGDKRPTLVLVDKTLVNPEEKFKEVTRLAIDAVWLGAKTLLGRDPTKLFAKPNGDVKTGSALTVGVTRFCERLGFTIGPKAIQVGVVRGLLAKGLSPRRIAEIIGVQQDVNISERFAPVIGATAPQRHADQLEKIGKLTK
jgi:hypothetical protein